MDLYIVYWILKMKLNDSWSITMGCSYIASLVRRNGYNWNCFFLLCPVSLWSAIHGNHSCCCWWWVASSVVGGRIGSLMKLFCIKPWRHYSNQRGLNTVKNGIMRIRMRYSRDLFHCNSNRILLKCTYRNRRVDYLPEGGFSCTTFVADRVQNSAWRLWSCRALEKS